MSQDTRKDRRVKIVSLNVRYKSATVDEFIENHAHDVSRGGIYIKTGNPFPPGTLLKFEIRLASDQAVIAGVGRVVWKRDPVQANGERPAGMGVKFIKIDEPSKSVIDRLVNTRDDAGKAYESEPETNEQPTPIAAIPQAAVAAAAAKPASASSGAVGAAATPMNRKATMMGLGTSGQSPFADGGPPRPKLTPAGGLTAPNAPPGAGGGAMFPESKPEGEGAPKQEQTVMKQAAELLEEALREAGGSMEEIGHNPLFTGGDGGKAAAKAEPAKEEKKAPPAEPREEKKASTPPAVKGDGDDAARARAMVAEMSPAPVRRSVSEPPPRTSRESPVAKRPSVPATAPAKKGGGGTFILLFVVVAAAAIGVVMFRDQIFGSGTPATTTTAAQLPPPPPPATTSAAAPTDTPSAATAAGSASAAPSASAAASASASAAPSASAPAAKPTAAPAQTAAATATAAPTQTAAATATPAPTATAASTSTGGAAATATAAPAPKPKPAPKPAPPKPDNDNPY